MKSLIIAAVICAAIVILTCLCGCSLLKPKTPAPADPIIAPTPGVQLWQAAKKSNWLVTLSILGMAGGVFALVNGSVKMGSATIAATSVSLFMTLAVARFALWLAVCGVIGSIAVVLFSILARRRALVEIIRGVQNFKSAERFDPNGDNAQLLRNRLEEQSPTTKKIVGDVKNKLKLAGKI